MARPDEHHLCFQDGKIAGAQVGHYQDLYWAKQVFWQLAQDPLTNWVKLYTIRGSDGSYLFQMEFQQRPEKAPPAVVSHLRPVE